MNIKFRITVILCLVLFFTIACVNNQQVKDNQFDFVLYNKIVKEYLQTSNQCTLLDTPVVLAFDITTQLYSRMEKFPVYFEGKDTIYKELLKSLLEKTTKGNNLMAVAACSAQLPEILFTLPIYNADKTKAVLCIQLVCGEDCAETILLFLKYDENEWTVISKNILAVI